MSFKSYAAHRLSDGACTLEDPQPLVFSGPHGLIARFGLSNPLRASDPWRLCAGELHAIAFPERLVRDRTIVFEQVIDDALELQALESVQGVSGRRTEMVFNFSPLAVVSAHGVLAIRRDPVARTRSETLDLDGGVLAPQGSWRWTRSHLALGGVTPGVGPEKVGRLM